MCTGPPGDFASRPLRQLGGRPGRVRGVRRAGLGGRPGDGQPADPPLVRRQPAALRRSADFEEGGRRRDHRHPRRPRRGGPAGRPGTPAAAACSSPSSGGTRARSNRSPLLAAEHDALVVVGYARRLPDDFRSDRWVRFEVGTEAILDPPRLRRDRHAPRPHPPTTPPPLERAVRRSPEQYFWVHPPLEERPPGAQTETAEAPRTGPPLNRRRQAARRFLQVESRTRDRPGRRAACRRRLSGGRFG